MIKESENEGKKTLFPPQLIFFFCGTLAFGLFVLVGLLVHEPNVMFEALSHTFSGGSAHILQKTLDGTLK